MIDKFDQCSEDFQYRDQWDLAGQIGGWLISFSISFKSKLGRRSSARKCIKNSLNPPYMRFNTYVALLFIVIVIAFINANFTS